MHGYIVFLIEIGFIITGKRNVENVLLYDLRKRKYSFPLPNCNKVFLSSYKKA